MFTVPYSITHASPCGTPTCRLGFVQADACLLGHVARPWGLDWGPCRPSTLCIIRRRTTNRNGGFVEADIRQCFNVSGAHIVAQASVTSKPSTGYSPCLLTRNYTKASLWVRSPTGSNLLVNEAGTVDSQSPACTPPSVNVLGSFTMR